MLRDPLPRTFDFELHHRTEGAYSEVAAGFSRISKHSDIFLFELPNSVHLCEGLAAASFTCYYGGIASER